MPAPEVNFIPIYRRDFIAPAGYGPWNMAMARVNELMADLVRLRVSPVDATRLIIQCLRSAEIQAYGLLDRGQLQPSSSPDATGKEPA